MAEEKEGALNAPLSVSGSEKPAPEAEKELDDKAEETAEVVTEIVADAVEEVKEEAEACQKEQAQDAAAFLETVWQMQQTHLGMMSDMLDKLDLAAERLVELTTPTTNRGPLTQEPLTQSPQEPTTEAQPETVVVAEVAPEKAEAEKVPPVVRRVRRVV